MVSHIAADVPLGTTHTNVFAATVRLLVNGMALGVLGRSELRLGHHSRGEQKRSIRPPSSRMRLVLGGRRRKGTDTDRLIRRRRIHG